MSTGVRIGLYPRKCAVCGKGFESRSEYGYRIMKKYRNNEYWYFCSYSCLREYQRKNPEKPEKNVKSYA